MLNGGAGVDELHGGAGNDGFFGGGGNDRIYGNAGTDTIYGDGGNDIIDGGAGDDILRGGTGADVFVFNFGAGSDQVLDFVDGQDFLDFSGLTPVASMADLDIIQTSASSITIHYFDGVSDVSLALVSAAPTVLDSSDFLI
jgi:Ca2+-binding RTX toxin-like protein